MSMTQKLYVHSLQVMTKTLLLLTHLLTSYHHQEVHCLLHLLITFYHLQVNLQSHIVLILQLHACIRFVFTSVKDAVAILSNSFREAKGSTVPEPNSLPHSTPPSKISLSASSSDHVLSPPSQSSVSNHSAVMRYVVHGNIICCILY